MAVVQKKRMRSGSWQREALEGMDSYEFRQWAELLEKRTGINLPEKRKSFLQTSLAIRMRELGFATYQDYLRYLLAGRRGAVEWEILVDRLTVHETRFYRDQKALELIRTRYLDTLSNQDGPCRINIWSVGCATGEEPYSLAILVDSHLQRRRVEFFQAIVASDISSAALATGRQGIYRENRLRNLSAHTIQRYFNRVGEEHYQVVPEIRDRVCFTRLNLVRLAERKQAQMDIIVCQNVLIYFARQKRLMILDTLARHLRPGGMLVLGAGEITDWEYPGLENMGAPGTLAYRRTTQLRSEP
ncbi:MAG TPA: protein-glutamate O-methyltransferase CheR [Chromatiales bacterium]|nr:protein-glutamate O-methyltransferase CheR [Chromatiales bacterium]